MIRAYKNQRQRHGCNVYDGYSASESKKRETESASINTKASRPRLQDSLSLRRPEPVFGYDYALSMQWVMLSIDTSFISFKMLFFLDTNYGLTVYSNCNRQVLIRHLSNTSKNINLTEGIST